MSERAIVGLSKRGGLGHNKKLLGKGRKGRKERRDALSRLDSGAVVCVRLGWTDRDGLGALSQPWLLISRVLRAARNSLAITAVIWRRANGIVCLALASPVDWAAIGVPERRPTFRLLPPTADTTTTRCAPPTCQGHSGVVVRLSLSPPTPWGSVAAATAASAATAAIDNGVQRSAAPVTCHHSPLTTNHPPPTTHHHSPAQSPDPPPLSSNSTRASGFSGRAMHMCAFVGSLALQLGACLLAAKTGGDAATSRTRPRDTEALGEPRNVRACEATTPPLPFAPVLVKPDPLPTFTQQIVTRTACIRLCPPRLRAAARTYAGPKCACKTDGTLPRKPLNKICLRLFSHPHWQTAR
ncbi:hypothetical protein P171DRAFT_166990 [Karstenula rhodostoma CBS 690.94]|uniref:Uncharacterized protein n=1 Tax=Karstenula rhodostoma CBS 690.94 TaxID=1392251 RepID=A0A9P4P630_9PLEO|nr:hypothetical protein P171DRAFT_166990 [Karstenula rhodostoma CBS 690.94]